MVEVGDRGGVVEAGDYICLGMGFGLQVLPNHDQNEKIREDGESFFVLINFNFV